MDRDNWARRLGEHFASGGEVNAAVLDLFNQRNFLEEIENQGLICLLNTIRKGRDNVKKALMIDDFLENKDINITVTHRQGYHAVLTVNQQMSTLKLYSHIFYALHGLQVDGQTVTNYQEGCVLKDIGIKPGCTVRVRDALQPLPRSDNLEEAQLASAILESQLQDSSACLIDDRRRRRGRTDADALTY